MDGDFQTIIFFLETLQLVVNLQDPRVIQGREDINRPFFWISGDGRTAKTSKA